MLAAEGLHAGGERQRERVTSSDSARVPNSDGDNIRAVQLLQGHTKLESTARYLGIVAVLGLFAVERWHRSWAGVR